jgi:diadenosine tetraphosphate (Ap4A) HIT family hydrolase
MQRISSDLLVKESIHTFVYLNPSPVLPGHSIVFPKKLVSQLAELNPEETFDLWSTVQVVSRVLRSVYSAPAFTIELKDKVSPGLFINLIPRLPGDLEQNDQLYPLLESMQIGHNNPELFNYVEVLRKELSN